MMYHLQSEARECLLQACLGDEVSRQAFFDCLEEDGVILHRQKRDSIDRLTEVELALLPHIRKAWLAIGLSSGETDRPMAEKAIAKCYSTAGMEPPEMMIWLPSPLQGVVASHILTTKPASEQVSDQVRDQVRDQVSEQYWSACYGSHDSDWLSYYSAMFVFGIDTSLAGGLIAASLHCGWFWPFDGLCVCTEKPTELVMRNGMIRLIRYSDGFEVRK